MGPGDVPRRARIGRLISVLLTLWLLSCPVGSWGKDVPTSGTEPGSRYDDWITINKDYSSQRYVALDVITPQRIRFLMQ
jgi:hypothetical protein